MSIYIDETNAARYDFSIFQGGSFSEIWQMKDDDGNPWDVENYDWKMQIRDAAGAAVALATWESTGADPEISLDNDNGFVQFAVEPADTVTLDFIVARYDLLAKRRSTGAITPALYGYITLYKQITEDFEDEEVSVPFGQTLVTAGEDVTANKAVYLYDDAGTTKCKLAKADAESTSKVDGFTMEAVASGSEVTVKEIGFMTDSSLTFTSPYGKPLWLSAATAGAITETPPATVGNILKMVGLTKGASTWKISITEGQQL